MYLTLVFFRIEVWSKDFSKKVFYFNLSKQPTYLLEKGVNILRLFNGSLSFYLLMYLAEVEKVQRKKLYIPFQNFCSYQYFCKTVQRLIQEGYLQLIRSKQKTWVSITEKGIASFKKKTEAILNKPISVKKSSIKTKKEKRRKILINDVVGFCDALDIAYRDWNKPSLETFLRPKTEQEKSDMLKYLKHGIFYSLKEIRSAFVNLEKGGQEFANWSRLIGIIWYNENLTFVYSIHDSLIKFIYLCESRTIKTILNLFESSDILRPLIGTGKPNCIVIGENMKMLTCLMYARKNGKILNNENKERFLEKISENAINAYNLQNVFENSYFIPNEKFGVSLFEISLQSEKEKQKAIDDWYIKNKFFRISSLQYAQGSAVSDLKKRIIYIDTLNLTALNFYKLQNISASFYVPNGTQEEIAKSLGICVNDMYNHQLEPIKFHRYNRQGILLEDISLYPNLKNQKK